MPFPHATWRWADTIKERIKRAAHTSQQKKDPKPLPKLTPLPKKKEISIFRLEDLLKTTRLTHLIPKDPLVPDEILKNKRLIAETIYHAMGHRYGFTEALTTGNFAPYPHELSEVTCATQMLVNYVTAKPCALNPVIKEVTGFRNASNSFVANHCFIEVDVGDTQPWMLCQSWRTLGPITWDTSAKKITVYNVIEKREQTFEYTFAETYTEEEYTQWMDYLRSPNGAARVLVPGQRVGFPDVDGWKTPKKLKAVWYIKYEAQTRSLLSKIAFQRPLVQNRGLENKLTFTPEGELACETITGYFYKTDGWAAFISATPMITLPVNKAEQLSEGIADFDLKKQTALEESIAQQCFTPSNDPSEQLFTEAITTSFETLKQTPTFSSLWKFVLCEALYQHAKKTHGKDFIYSESERMRAFKLFDDVSDYENLLLEKKKLIEKLKNTIKQHDAYLGAGRYVGSFGSHWCRVLDTRRMEYEDVRQFINIRTSNELTLYQLENEARFCDDAADRVCYAKNEVQQHAATLETLETAARTILRPDADKHFMAAYGRIFTEFLGMIAFASKELRLIPYRETVIEKVKNYKF